ncbi:glycine receptor subunit alphaZ1-like [Centruroides sculpturatus]|uniref:glycine receptor subunit alphaZ1-like n=1 Tax=Centruroides sculpturatus TaxID=218467 RepID=UPI000C6EC787|nr:glycine receptor subunit alphaZ1-like [Centruroides sculpturatus]
MDLHRYPLDIQDCVFKIGLLKNTAEKVRLEWCDVDSSPCKYLGPSIALMEDIQPLKHEMKVPKPRSKIEVWTTGNYSYLYAKFTFIRRLTGSILNVYLPSTLVVTMSWLSFWLDVNAVPARVTLGVTSLLTIITQMLQSRSYTPPVDYVKAVDIWLLACMFFVTASLIEYAFALQSVEFKEKRNSPRPVKKNEKCDEKRKTSKEKIEKVKGKLCGIWKIFKMQTTLNDRRINVFHESPPNYSDDMLMIQFLHASCKITGSFMPANFMEKSSSNCTDISHKQSKPMKIRDENDVYRLINTALN